VGAVALISAAIAVLIRKKDSKRFLTTTSLSVVDKEVQRACNYVEKNYYRQDLTVETLCEELVTGASFLQALFDRELGMSVDDFMDQVRINRARIELGEQPAIPIEELTERVGYLNPENLKKKFASLTGVSLEQYRNNV
jgi:two-component system response regulator YesN